MLSIQAIKGGEYLSAAAAARSFEIPVSTLKAQISGREFATEKRPSGPILIPIGTPQSTESWILDMASRGAALTLPLLRDMAIFYLAHGENSLCH